MKLSNGRHMLAIPGPSIMPDRVLQAMHRPAPNIYSGLMEEITYSVIADLKRVACTKGDVAIYISNGHGVWEASLANVMNKGDKVLALASGRFGEGWAQVARRLGGDVQLLNYGVHKSFDEQELRDALIADKSHEIKLLITTHVDTSSSIRYDIPKIRAILDDVGHPALLMVDCIASLGCDRFEMDQWGVDVMIAASQKGLMTPPGIAFVFANEKAKALREGVENVSPYWDWKPRLKPQIFYQYYGGTAPTHHLFGLNEALKMILDEEGLENIWRRHEVLANAIWAAFDAWGNVPDSTEPAVTMNVTDPSLRSHAVTTAKISHQRATPMRIWLEESFGLTLGIGLGMAEMNDPEINSYFRIGHMGHLNAHMLLGTLSSVQAGLINFEIPHGNNAIENAALICTQHLKTS